MGMLWVLLVVASLALASELTPEEVATKKSVDLLKASIDCEVDACEDFYQFACDTRLKFKIKMINLLNGDSLGSLNLARLRQFWRSCNNYDPSQKQIDEALEKTANKLREALLPVKSRSSSLDSQASLPAQAARMRKSGLNPGVFFHLASLSTPGGMQLLLVGQREQEAIELNLEELRNISNYLRDFGTNFKKITRLAGHLARYSRPDLDSEQSIHMSLAQLQAAAPNTNWIEYLSSATDRNISPDSKQIMVVVPNLDYIKQVDRLLSNRSSTLIIDFTAAITLVETYREVRRKTPLECFNDTMRFMGPALNSAYMEEFVSQEELAGTIEMAQNIQEAYLELLDKSTWPSETIKQRAKSKIRECRLNLGNIAELLIDPNGSQLDKMYKWVDFKRISYPDSKTIIKDAFEEITDLQIDNRAYFDMIGWLKRPEHSYSAFFRGTANSINILAGMLQDRFTDIWRRQYLNYGLLGSTIGHELTHGLDPTGIDMDATGSKSILTQVDRNLYDNRTNCMLSMFDGHKIEITPGEWFTSDGNKTLKENIADSGGFLAAYYGYRKWVQRHGTEARLPGIGLTPRQLFWVSLASKFCKLANKNDTLHKLEKDLHSHWRLRVNLQLANYREFRRDFKCHPKSSMVMRPGCKFL